MKILLVNKFLFPNGGSETYVLTLGKFLKEQGHDVQYFGMEDERRIVGNQMNLYTENIDFHHANVRKKLKYSIKSIYNQEARKKIRKVLDDYVPDVVHLNNFNYQLTPSIILETDLWRKKNGHKCRIIYTAHDYNLICPNHLLYNPVKGCVCEKCLKGNYAHCFWDKCIHGSSAKSAVGAAESYFWRLKGVYQRIDRIICCSQFIKNKIDSNRFLSGKTILIRNFVDKKKNEDREKRGYVIYFGRYSKEKGFDTLLKACKACPGVEFVFAGSGPLEYKLNEIKNIKNLGFLQGVDLEKTVGAALFSIIPSEWYENCPLSVMESQILGTPVIGSNIGGIPELIQAGNTGELFMPGDVNELIRIINRLFNDRKLLDVYTNNCNNLNYEGIEEYYERLMELYCE